MSASQPNGNREQSRSTVVSETGVEPVPSLCIPALTVLAHPQTERVGERVLLPALASGDEPSVPAKEERKPRSRHFRTLAEISDGDILAALQADRFNLTRAAGRLGISRTVLYGWVERHPELRKASALSREEIAAALAGVEGDVDAAADRLGVSRHGLRIRRSALGIE